MKAFSQRVHTLHLSRFPTALNAASYDSIPASIARALQLLSARHMVMLCRRLNNAISDSEQDARHVSLLSPRRNKPKNLGTRNRPGVYCTLIATEQGEFRRYDALIKMGMGLCGWR